MSHNHQWKKQCDALMCDLEAAKRELSECQQLGEQKLQEEQEKTSKAVVSRSILSLYIVWIEDVN